MGIEGLTPMAFRGEFVMSRATEQLDIGAFMVQIGLLREAELAEIRGLAASTGLPIRNALSLSRQVPEHLLDAAYRLYQITRTSKLPTSVVKDALALIRDQGLTVENALAKAGMAGQIIGYSRLGTLLVEANLITKEHLDEARKTSFETGLPLGRMLQLQGVIDQATVDLALELQKQLRSQSISKDEALKALKKDEALKALKKEQATKPGTADGRDQIDQNRAEASRTSARKKVRVIDLLLLSGAVTEMDVLDAVETSLNDKRPLTQILLTNHSLDTEALLMATQLRESVEEGSLHILEATDALHYISTTGKDDRRQECRAGTSTVDFISLLTRAQVITDYDVSHAIEALRHYPSLIGKLLITSGAIDESILLAALRCHQFVSRRYISEEDAVKALHHAITTRHTFEDSLSELGMEIAAPIGV